MVFGVAIMLTSRTQQGTAWFLTLMLLLLSSSGGAQEKGALGANNMKVLKVEWHRLVADGQTCLRCGDTGKEVEKACQPGTITEIGRAHV